MAKKVTDSKTVDMLVQCPFCGESFDYPMYPEITIPGDSKLKKKVLNKTLFYPKCPLCKEEIKLRARCIYRNETQMVMIVVTDFKDPEIENMLMSGDIHFNDVRSDDDIVDFMKGLFVRRVVYDVDSFREKILLADHNYDDRIVELMKLSLSKLLEKETDMPVYRIFLEEMAGNQLEFVAIMGSHAPYEYINIRSDASVYTQYKNKYLDQLGRPEEDEYIITDQNWAFKSQLLKDEGGEVILPD